jgi:hypothetical protein
MCNTKQKGKLDPKAGDQAGESDFGFLLFMSKYTNIPLTINTSPILKALGNGSHSGADKISDKKRRRLSSDIPITLLDISPGDKSGLGIKPPFAIIAAAFDNVPNPRIAMPITFTLRIIKVRRRVYDRT